MRKTTITLLCLAVLTALLGSCMGSKLTGSTRGGEVTGYGTGRGFTEPTPYGMVMVNRGFLNMGQTKNDSLWGKSTPSKEISVDGFWMDETEVTNAKYRQFVMWVRDSILRTRLADPAYGGDETYMITEDKNGEPITPHLNWSKSIPWKNPDEDQLRAIESIYTTHPFDGTKMLDVKQLNYRYEIFDYVTAAKRKYRLDPEERNLNTDVTVNPNETIWISKDTAYVDDEGVIHRQTITRPLSSMWDFVNTYIVICKTSVDIFKCLRKREQMVFIMYQARSGKT